MTDEAVECTARWNAWTPVTFFTGSPELYKHMNEGRCQVHRWPEPADPARYRIGIGGVEMHPLGYEDYDDE